MSSDPPISNLNSSQKMTSEPEPPSNIPGSSLSTELPQQERQDYLKNEIYKKAGLSFCAALIVLVVVALFIMQKDPDYEVIVDAKTNRYTLNPKEGLEHKYTLIFLHGEGQFGNQDSLLSWFLYQGSNRMTPLNCRIILPKAPIEINTKATKVYLYQKEATKSVWFQVFKGFAFMRTLELKRNLVNQETLKKSGQIILDILREETQLLGDQSRVFIGGINSGSVAALQAFLLYNDPQPLGGVIGINTMYLMQNEDKITDQVEEVHMNTPMLQIYGLQRRPFQIEILEDSLKIIKKIYNNGSKNLTQVADEDMGLKWDYHVTQGIAGWIKDKMSADE